MPRWLFLLPLLLPACAPDLERETLAAQAALASHRASLDALGVPGGAPAGGRPAPQPQPPARPPAAIAEHNLHPPTHAPSHASALMGASPEAVRAALGEPLLRREEGPAQVWLYAGGGCQLDIVLYPAEGGPRVAHVQARAGGLAQRTEASCLRELASQGGARGHGGTRGTGPASLGHPVEIEA